MHDATPRKLGLQYHFALLCSGGDASRGPTSQTKGSKLALVDQSRRCPKATSWTPLGLDTVLVRSEMPEIHLLPVLDKDCGGFGSKFENVNCVQERSTPTVCSFWAVQC
eukprot:3901175-Rhodomonas_salina.3